MPSWELIYIYISYIKALLSRRFSQLPVRWDSPCLEHPRTQMALVLIGKSLVLSGVGLQK